MERADQCGSMKGALLGAIWKLNTGTSVGSRGRIEWGGERDESGAGEAPRKRGTYVLGCREIDSMEEALQAFEPSRRRSWLPKKGGVNRCKRGGAAVESRRSRKRGKRKAIT